MTRSQITGAQPPHGQSALVNEESDHAAAQPLCPTGPVTHWMPNRTRSHEHEAKACRVVVRSRHPSGGSPTFRAAVCSCGTGLHGQAPEAAWRPAAACGQKSISSTCPTVDKFHFLIYNGSMRSTVPITCPRLRLSELAHVQPGYLSRDRVLPAQDGTHRLLQARDVSEADGVRLEAAIQFHPKGRPDLYQVSCGDILVTARGQNHRAYLVDQVPPNVLAAATFYILRANINLIVPGYLAWWLNLPGVQSVIDTASGGTYISFIRRPALENLSVLVPAP